MGHAEHAIEPMVLNVPLTQASAGWVVLGHAYPAGQGMHLVEPSSDVVPGAQGSMASEIRVGQAKPALHGVQLVALPSKGVVVPAGHKSGRALVLGQCHSGGQ